jgi:uncharacterized protein YegL
MNFTSFLNKNNTNLDLTQTYINLSLRTQSENSQNESKIDKTTTCRICILADTSTSMAPNIVELKSSLAAITDLIQKSEYLQNWELNIITFDSDSCIIYRNTDNKSDFKEAIDTIVCRNKTNYKSALELCNKIYDENPMTTWVLLLSDGFPTEGNLLSSDSLSLYTRRNRLKRNMVYYTFGYGNDYSPTILESIGKYTHINGVDCEAMSVTFIDCVYEITKTYAINLWCQCNLVGDSYVKQSYGDVYVQCVVDGVSYDSIIEIDEKCTTDSTITIEYTTLDMRKHVIRVSIQESTDKPSIRVLLTYLKHHIQTILKSRYSNKSDKLNKLLNMVNYDDYNYTQQDINEIELLLEKTKSTIEKLNDNSRLTVSDEYQLNNCINTQQLQTPLSMRSLTRETSKFYNGVYSK